MIKPTAPPSKPGFVAAFRTLCRASGGTALLEFALSLPIITTIGMFGLEIAYLAVVNLQLSQISILVADNASRLGQSSTSSIAPSVTAAEVSSILNGALKQGEMVKLGANGRVILSSLEYSSADAKQYIHWQRCIGQLQRQSDYGNDGTNNGLTEGKPLGSIGNGAQKITAPTDSAVMFVEVFYDYKGLFGTLFVQNKVMKREAAFIVRDNRDLTSGLSGTDSATACGS